MIHSIAVWKKSGNIVKKRSSLIWRQLCWGSKYYPGHCRSAWGVQQPFFMLLPCPFCASYFRAAAGSSLGSGDACRSLRRACAHNAPCTGEPQKKFNELAASMLELAALVRGLAATLLFSRTRYDINRRRIEVRKPIKTHNPIFSSLSLATSWCFSRDQKSQFFVGA